MNQELFDSLWSPVEGAPAQCPEELFWLVNKVEALNPKAILEIGVARGGTLRYWEQLVPVGFPVVGIEMDQTVQEQIEEWWDWRKSNRRLGVVIGDSLNQEVINHVKNVFKNQKLDFLFIDGAHDPEYIFKEFVIYGEMVRNGGLIAFHDIRPEMHLQYVFGKIRGYTERFLVDLGIGIYHKGSELKGRHLVFQRHNNEYDTFDLDKPQADRLKEVWRSLKFEGW